MLLLLRCLDGLSAQEFAVQDESSESAAPTPATALGGELREANICEVVCIGECMTCPLFLCQAPLIPTPSLYSFLPLLQECPCSLRCCPPRFCCPALPCSAPTSHCWPTCCRLRRSSCCRGEGGSTAYRQLWVGARFLFVVVPFLCVFD